MALPALMSLQFAPHSALYGHHERLDWAQAVISADGIRHLPGISPALGSWLWSVMLLIGLLVLLPSQLSVVDEVSRRWTDVIWSANARVRDTLGKGQVKYIYYTILAAYIAWCVMSLYVFSRYGTPKLMTLIIANLGNVALGFTAFQILLVNRRLLPPPLRPRWYHQLGLNACGIFYLGMAALVFFEKQWPVIRNWIGA
jgi:hypothetical protein